MSIDINFWKYKKDAAPDHLTVYQQACCDHETLEELEVLPIDNLLEEVRLKFGHWQFIDPYNYEAPDGQGSFQITTTPQTIRFDCYSMAPSDMKQFSSLMAKFDCPLYDPQQNIRFDKIAIMVDTGLTGYTSYIQQKISNLLPRLERTARTMEWDEYMQLSKELSCIHLHVNIHRGKSMTKVITFMRFGNGWTNRPCQGKNTLLDDPAKAPQVLQELLDKSVDRAVHDFFEKTYYL